MAFMHITDTLQLRARRQWLLAVKEHWCSGEEEFYGCSFWLLPPFDDMACSNKLPADLTWASDQAVAVARERGY